MAYDLVIRNGTVVDGSGMVGYRADVGVVGNRIAKVGRISEKGHKEIDAEGQIVSPGFVDSHTHMDAQLFWDFLGRSSCWGGVTSVVMGNCGFTLAPSRAGLNEMVTSNFERAENISGEAMAKGIDWTWESFPEYLDAVVAQPKAINYASQVGHTALRTAVMGERSFTDEATEDDMALMIQLLRDAMRAGAVGFSTSRTDLHLRMDGSKVASDLATWDEIRRLVGVLSEEGAGVFEIALQNQWRKNFDLEAAKAYYQPLKDLSIETGIPIAYGLSEDHVDHQLDILDEAAAEGGKIFGESRSWPKSLVFSFKSQMPYDQLPEWKEFRSKSLQAQLEGLRDPAKRKYLSDALKAAFASGQGIRLVKTKSHPEPLTSLDKFKVMRPGMSNVSVNDLARERGVDPVDLIFDLALETNLEQAFVKFQDWADKDILTTLKHPRTLMCFGDAGAHVSYIAGSELPTALLVRWVREREALTLEEAVRMLTLVPAMFWHLPERGLLREGMVADINVFDLDRLSIDVPTIEHDTPDGSPRVQQTITGYTAAVVSGKQTFASGEHTGEYPGELLRGPLATASR